MTLLLKSFACFLSLAWICCGTARGQAPAAHAAPGNPPGAAAPETKANKDTAGVKDPLTGPLLPGWKWLREHKDGWKHTPDGLQVLVEPGNMWGAANDAKNVLLYPVPDALVRNAELRVTLSHNPSKRWEQANLVWYYTDSTMVKLGLEIENGVMNIVMGREENDQTKTIAVLPWPHQTAELRMVVKDLELTGSYRLPGEAEWKEAGKATLPENPPAGPAASLQFYQGEAASGRWATARDFRLLAGF